MERNGSDPGRLRVRRKTLEALLAECQRAIQLGTLELEGGGGDDSADDSEADDCVGSPSSANFRDDETTERQLCDLIKSRVECPDFLEKLETAQASASLYNAEESASWDMVNENDAWEGDKEFDQEYVLVRQEDILDGIACFMATYLLSLKETKELTPNQLQDVLCKAFSVKKKKGKLRKAWDGSRVVYNVASWGATAIGIYQNPAILKAASAAFWTSCHVISKLF